MNVHTGKLDASGMRLAIVVARFNDFVAERLLQGAIDAFVRHGGSHADVAVYWVPGSFEIPFVVQEVATAGGIDMVVCLGVVIRGETPHFDYVAGEAARVGQMGVQHRLPVSFGVITTENLEQAIDRAGGKSGNKGADACLAAIEVVSLIRGIRGSAEPRRRTPPTPRVV